MGFPRQDYWSGLPYPSLDDLPDPGMEHMFSALEGGYVFTTELPLSVGLYIIVGSAPTTEITLYIDV